MRSTRFDRKGPKALHGKTTEEVVICQYRGQNEPAVQEFPVQLQSIPFDSIRSFQNLEAYPYAFEADLDVIHWACGMAGESPTVRLLLKEAQTEGWNIRLDDLEGNGYELDDEAHCLVLDHFGFTAQALGRSAYYRNALFVNFVRVLRSLWHDRQDYKFETMFRPDALLMLERVREADCETVAILAGWELRGAGHADIWRSILGAEEGDMAMIFTRAIEKDPAGFYDGSVLARTLCQWYGDENRVAEHDQGVLEDMDDMLQAAHHFGNASLAAQAIERISLLPGGVSYLSGMGTNIASDPYFVALNDAINEAHLFQIVYDNKVVMVEGVPFRDSRLARKIFPMGLVALKD